VRHGALGLASLFVVTLSGCPSVPPTEGIDSAGPSQSAASSSTSVSPEPSRGSVACEPSGKGTDYEVGPGKKYGSLGEVPFENLGAGDTVRVHHRPEPYREKVMISGVGTAQAPIVLCGIPGPNGELPVIDGEGATTRPSLVFPFEGHQVRGLVIVGWKHSDPWTRQPEHIVVQGFELRNAAVGKRFTDRAQKDAAYSGNAAGIYVQRASHVVLRGNFVHDNENGLFVGGGGEVELTTDVLIEGNDIRDNGSAGDYYHHNVYNEGSGITYQFNRFGPPKGGKQGILGANIKERSAGVVIRYNYVEDGAHLIDLVDAQEARDPNLKSPSFHESWVYGNVLVRGPISAGSMVHYGGDSGMLDTYRKGTLHFFHNTVVVENAPYKDYETAAIFELSTNDEALDSKNNVYFSAAPKPNSPVSMLGARDHVVSGKASFSGDWIRAGILPFDGTASRDVKVVATESGFGAAMRGEQPGFRAAADRDFSLVPGAPVKEKGAAVAYDGHAVRFQIGALRRSVREKSESRPSEPRPTPGAFAPSN